jgi:hypothetical protein
MAYQFDVFICHASKDKKRIVQPLCHALEQAGFAFWLDEKDIPWGADIMQTILTGLRMSRYFIAVVSARTIGRQWPATEIGAALFREETRLLPLIVGNEVAIFQKFSMLQKKKYVKWSGDPTKVVAALLALDEDYYRSVWIHHHPADYSGEVWMGIEPCRRNLQRPHHFAISWGPWRYTGQVAFTSVEAIYYIYHKGRDRQSFAITLEVQPAAHLMFGTGTPPEPRAINIDKGWSKAK